MRMTWMFPAAALAVVCFAACGGGEKTNEATRPKTDRPAAAPAGGGGYMVAAVSDGGTVAGKITLTGPAPAVEMIEVTKDNQVCGQEKKAETVQVGPGGGLANAVVWIDGISKGKDWGSLDGITVDQKECHYTPHVQIMRAGETVEIVNSDAVLHNIHAYYKDTETLFNLAQPIQGQKTPKKIEKTGPVHLKCDVHSWMSGWVFVASHPYFAVTKADGSFSLPDVPAGTYKAKAWHEKYGEKTIDVTVTAGGSAAAEFSMP
jgi:plastocyanin